MARWYSIALAVLLGACAYGQDKPAEVKKEKPKDGNELLVKPSRTLEFKTDEGTWMALDLSPDGQTIVFELLGDLYTIPAAGGEAKRLVGGIHFDMQPRWSPDGKKIAFISDRSGAENLWLVDADGSNPKALTTGRKTNMASPTWSPDGNYVVVSKSQGFGSFSVLMVDIRGGTGIPAGPKAATPGARGTNRMGAIFSPDGRFMYYAERQGLWTYDSKFPLWQIKRYDQKTGDVATVTNAMGSAMRPMLSPDGKTLVYATRFRNATALRARDLVTSDERWLAFPIDRDDQEAVASRDTIPGYCFTKDGKNLIMSLGGKIQKINVATGKATVIPFTADVKLDAGKSVHYDYKVDQSPTVKARIIRDASLSPDGKKLLFTAFSRIYTMAYPGGTPARLTKDDIGEFGPSWSPDGKSVVYTTWSPFGGYVCKADASTGKSIHLTPFAGYYASPVYLPDGQNIAYMSSPTQDGIRSSYVQETHCLDLEEMELGNIGAAAPADIYYISSFGGASKYVSSSAGAGAIQTGMDPNRLYMVGAAGLSTQRLDGFDKRDLLKVTAPASGPNPLFAEDIRISRDGQRAFVSIKNQIYVLTLPMLGASPLEMMVTDGPGLLPVKKINPEGGDYLNWTADGMCVTWTLGDKFYCQKIDADKPEVTTINVEMPRHQPKGTLVLKGARIITMKGDEVLPKGDVVVTDGRITFVGPNAVVPAGATVMNMSGKTISPGFIDVHSHWFGGQPKLPQSWGYLANLAYGVTTNRDPQSGGTDIYDYSDSIETGQAIGPRIYTTGPGVFSEAGHDTPESTKNFIKRYAEAYKTNTLKEYMSGDRMNRQQVVLACDQYKITPTCEGGLDFKLNMTHMIDGFSGHEHSLPITPIHNDVVQLIAKSNTFYTPTLLVNYGAPTGENYWFERYSPSDNAKLRRFVPDELLDTMVRRRANWVMDEEYNFSKIAEGCAKVVRAGGRVCIGSHGQLQGLGAHWEMWSLASGGMKPLEVLKCATIFGAEAIGLASDIGSIEKGKLADLVIYDKNPLDDIRNTNTIKYVIRGGDVFEGDTMDQVWPVKKKLGPIYYQNYGPSQTIK
jgi:Tol biopolymer transport system component